MRRGSDKYETIIYVHDHITFGTIPKVESEVANFMNDSRMLIGHDAIQESKNEEEARIDAIGWGRNSDQRLVSGTQSTCFRKNGEPIFNELTTCRTRLKSQCSN